MESRTTTTSCTLLALVITTCVGAIALGAQGPARPSTASTAAAILKRKFSPFPALPRWTLALNSALAAQPAFDGTLGYFPLEGDRLVAYDLTVGTLLWTATATTRSAPAAGGGLVFLDPPEALRALKASDGSLAWETPFADALTVPLVLDRGWLFAATPTALLAFQANDGSLVWRREIAGVRAAPAVAADRLYLSLDDGRVMAARIMDGETVWQHKLGAGMPNEILAVDTQLFVGSTDNYLYCLKADTGEIAWPKRTGADVVSRPFADNDNVYFVSLDNVLRALNRGHGVQQWMVGLPFRPPWPPIAALDAIVAAGPALPARAYFLKDGKPADVLTIEKPGDIVAPLHTFPMPSALGPIIVLVTRSVAGDVTVTAVSRAIEPPPIPLMAPLPTPGATPGLTPGGALGLTPGGAPGAVPAVVPKL